MVVPLGFIQNYYGESSHFLRLARVKTLLLPYGGDVQDLKFMNNLNFKHSTISDYPEQK